MKAGDAQTADDDRKQQRCIGSHEAGDGQTQTRKKDADGKQPGQRNFIGYHAKQRLDY